MNEPYRVAQIMGKLWAGGVEMVVFNYYRAIDHSKIQFDFYYDDDSTVTPPEDLIEMGARFIRIPAYQNVFAYMNALEREFKSHDYQIVHSHINTLSIFPLYVAWKCGIPVRIAHNHSVPEGDGLWRMSLKYFLKSFSRLFSTDYFACSEKAGRWLWGNRLYDCGRVVVLKNAIDFERFQCSNEEINQIRNEVGVNASLVVAHVGRFTFAKNHKFIIDLFSEILKVQEDAVLLLVGDGEMRNQIYDWVDEKGISDKVIFTGQVTNPEMFYGLADVVVIPSIFEGLSLAAIESQAAGVPTVVSNAIPEEAIISNGVRRLELYDEKWVDTIFEVVGQKVVLNNKSKEYDINYASKKLEGFYLDKLRNSIVGGAKRFDFPYAYMVAA